MDRFASFSNPSTVVFARLRRHTQLAHPRQAGFDAAARPVFATDPAGVARGVDGVEDGAVGQFALVGFGAAGYGGDLDVTDQVPVAVQPGDDVALGDADVVDVEHDAYRVRPDFVDQC